MRIQEFHIIKPSVNRNVFARFRASRILVRVIFFETSRFDNSRDTQSTDGVLLWDFISNLNPVRRTYALSILILKIDLGLIKMPLPSLWSMKGVLSGEENFSPKESKDCTKGGCASIRSLSAIFQNWSFTTGHCHVSLHVATGKAFEPGYVRSCFSRLIVSNKGFKDYKNKSWR